MAPPLHTYPLALSIPGHPSLAAARVRRLAGVRTCLRAAVLLTLLAGCGARPSTADRPPPSPVDVASARVDRGVARAFSVSERIDPIRALVRYLPAPCDCPEWEVFLRGRWERVELRPARSASDDDAAALEGSARDGEPVMASVSRTGDQVRAADDWVYAVYDVSEIGRAPADDTP